MTFCTCTNLVLFTQNAYYSLKVCVNLWSFLNRCECRYLGGKGGGGVKFTAFPLVTLFGVHVVRWVHLVELVVRTYIDIPEFENKRNLKRYSRIILFCAYTITCTCTCMCTCVHVILPSNITACVCTRKKSVHFIH